jgi:hypothetical protein
MFISNSSSLAHCRGCVKYEESHDSLRRIYDVEENCCDWGKRRNRVRASRRHRPNRPGGARRRSGGDGPGRYGSETEEENAPPHEQQQNEEADGARVLERSRRWRSRREPTVIEARLARFAPLKSTASSTGRGGFFLRAARRFRRVAPHAKLAANRET